MSQIQELNEYITKYQSQTKSEMAQSKTAAQAVELDLAAKSQKVNLRVKQN